MYFIFPWVIIFIKTNEFNYLKLSTSKNNLRHFLIMLIILNTYNGLIELKFIILIMQ